MAALWPSGQYQSRDWDLTVLFDEDECREFLGRLGDKVVNTYNFVMGMEESYSAIYERYGLQGASDAISLLHEVLEEQDVVGAGLGLETDIWRVWTRAFRLRNINPHAPWLPHVGTRIMPPATPPHIRRIRARNFQMNQSVSTSASEQEQSQTESSMDSSNPNTEQKAGTLSMLDGSHAEKPDVPTMAHQRMRTMFQLEDDRTGLPPTPANDDQARIGEVKRLSSIVSRRPTISTISSMQDVRPQSAQIETPNLDQGIAQAWLALTNSQPPTPVQTQAPNESTATLQPLRYIPGSTAAHFDRAQALQAPRPELYPSYPQEDAQTLQPFRYEPGPVAQEVGHTRASEAPGDRAQTLQPRRNVEDSELVGPSNSRHAQSWAPHEDISTPPAQEPSSGTASEHAVADPAEVGRPEAVSAEIQYAHRNATLLAGEIRTPVTPRNIDEIVDEAAKESVTSVRSAAPKKCKSYKSRLLAFLGVGEKKQRAELPDFCGCIFKGKPSASCFSSTQAATSTTEPRPRLMHIANYDGACSPRPSVSSSHLNKPLPLTPGDHDFSAPSRAASTAPPSMRRKEYNPPLTGSSTDTQSSTATSRDRFRQIAQDLLEGEMISTPKLPMNEDVSHSPAARLEPRKYEPSQPSPRYYNSIALSNPFTDKPVFVSQASSKEHDELEEDYFVSDTEEVPPVPILPAMYYDPKTGRGVTQPPGPYPHATRRQESPTPRPSEQLHHHEHDRMTLSQNGSSSSPENASSTTDERRGRPRARPQTPRTEESSPNKRGQSNASKRSRSPFKRMLGIGKSTPSKDTGASLPEATPSSSAKRSLKDWSYKIKHGFLAPDPAEQEREKHMEEYENNKTVPKKLPASTFPISLDPAYQARLQADLELMILISANRFLMREAQAGRIPKYSVDKFRRNWEANNMPQVIEYQFDMATQRAMIMENIKTVEFCGQVAENPLTLAATLHSWGSMIYEISIRTFCAGDSVVRKWLNDGQRILEMLGAPYVTLSTFDKMSTKALLVINHRQRLARAEDASEASEVQSEIKSSKHTRNFSDTSYVFRSQEHKRSASHDSYIHGLYGSMAAQLEALDPLPVQNAASAPSSNAGPPQAVVAEPKPQEWPVIVPTVDSRSYNMTQTLPRDAYEESRGGRLGLMRNATPASANNPFSRQSPGRMGYREL